MAKDERPIEEIVAGDKFRNSLIERADAHKGHAPLWHGWALMDAFLAGIDYARNIAPMTPPVHRKFKSGEGR